MNDASRPWLRRREWCEGVMRRTGSISAPDKWGMFAFIAAVLIGVLLLHNSEYFGFYFFASLVVGVVAQVVITWVLAARIGSVEFRFDEVPFVIGSKIRGTIVAPFRTSVDEYRSVDLLCARGENTLAYHAVPLMPGAAVRIGDRVHIPVEFDASGVEAEPTGWGLLNAVQWDVLLNARFNGLSYSVRFDIPVAAFAAVVQKTAIGKSSRSAVAEQQRMATQRARIAAAEIPTHDAAWLRNPEWRAGVVKSRTTAVPSSKAQAAIFWVAVPICGFMFLTFPSRFALIFVAVPAVFLAMAYGSIAMRQRRTAPPSEFRFERVPFILGGKLRGTIVVPLPSQPEGYTRVVLNCVEGERTPFTQSHSLQPERVVPVNGVAHVAVDFDLPHAAPVTATGTIWQITFDAQCGFMSYRAAFKVPVFAKNAEALVENTGIARREVPADLRKALSVFDDDQGAT